VIELRSRTDALEPLKAKMQEYFNSGLSLGWLINPQPQQVEIYRPNQGNCTTSTDFIRGRYITWFRLRFTNFPQFIKE
jgi:Uma2 family endonuclease